MSSEGPPPGLLCARGRPCPPAWRPRQPPPPPPDADGSLRPPTRRLPRSPRGGAGRAAGGPSARRLTAAPEGQRPDDRRLNSRPPGPPSNTGTSAPLHSEPRFRFHQRAPLPPTRAPRRGGSGTPEGPSRRAARPPPIWGRAAESGGAGEGGRPRDPGDVVRGRGGWPSERAGPLARGARRRPGSADGADPDPALRGGGVGQPRGQKGLGLSHPRWEEPAKARGSS